MIDVNPNHLETVKRILAEHVPECEVRAFGSRVDWTAKDYSDLDLVVVCDDALDPDVLRRLRETFEESDLPFRVDVLDWQTISAAFQKVIEKKYQVLHNGKRKLGVGSEWRETTLDQLGRIVTGKTPPASREYFRGDIPFVTPTDFDGRRIIATTGRYLTHEGADSVRGARVQPGAVMVSCIGSDMGKAAVAGRECVTNQQINSIIVSSGDDPLFVYYNLSSRKTEIHTAASGSAQPILNKSAFGRFNITLPPPEVQRTVSRILGTLDDKIELNRWMNETLEATARALFKSWFVDFDPVRAKAEGRDSGLPQAIADLFPDSFEDSALGEIPTGWDVGPFLRTARLLSGGTPKTDRPEYWDGGIRWASAKDVSQCSDAFLVATERTITKQGLDESATQLVPAFSSVVVARGATTGRMAMVGDVMAMNQTCYALESTAGVPFSLYCHLRQEMDKLVHGAHGSVFDTITTSTFATSEVVLPTNAALRVFEQEVSPLFRRILAATEESRTLAALRDTLLPKLISGELRMPDTLLHDRRALGEQSC